MELIEPAAVFASRCASSLPAPPRPLQAPTRPAGDGVWQTILFDTLNDFGQEPVNIMSLINAVARRGNYTRWKDYDAKRREILGLVCRLIRVGGLDRVARRYVALPRSDDQRRAYLEAAAQPLALPPPNL